MVISSKIGTLNSKQTLRFKLPLIMKNWGRLIGSLSWPDEGATAWIVAVGQGSFAQRGRWWKNAPKNKA